MKLYDKINNNEIYVIAEMSANHGGSIENAYRIIEQAAEAGADCVKIQTYTADCLTLNCKKDPYQIKGGLWDGYNYYELYQEAMTPWEWQADLKKRCEACGVDFLSTPFEKKGVDFLEDLGVEFYKIASYEMIDIPLVRYIASKGKPIVMSVGMGSEEEIGEALAACREMKNEQVVILKCCSQYPAQYEDMNIAAIPLLREKFGIPVGLSDHSFGSLADVVAVSMGACVIEKHVKLDDESIQSADSGFSMKMSDFAQMVSDVRNAKIIMGRPTLELTAHEQNGLSGRRSLAASRPIKAGEIFTEENVRSVRPAIGIKPKYMDNLLGQAAKNDYEFGDPIRIDEVHS